MRKLKRKSDGIVFDCTIVEGRLSDRWDNAKVCLMAVYFDKSSNAWIKEPLSNFKPAEPNIDY